MIKLHLKRCLICALFGLSVGGCIGWKGYETSMNNPMTKFVITGKVF